MGVSFGGSPTVFMHNALRNLNEFTETGTGTVEGIYRNFLIYAYVYVYIYIRDCGSTLYVGLPHAAPTSN